MSRIATAVALPAWSPWFFSTGVGPGGFGDASMGSGPNPYGSPNVSGGPPPKQSKMWLWILLGLGGGVALACCGCLGFGGLGLFGAGKMLAGAVKNQYQNHPIVQEQIGEIQSCEWNFIESSKETGANPDAGSQIQVFDVKGPKGSGQIYGPQLQMATDNRFLKHGTLRKNGQTFDLGE